MWCYWLHDFNADRLTLLHLDLPAETDENAETLEQLSEVLLAAQSEAAIWSLEQVSIWDPDPHVSLACGTILGIKPKVREDIQRNIPCLRWKGDSGECIVETGIDWVRREMYPWC